MSQENVEMVERAYSGGGDIIAEVIEALHPEVELLGAIGGMEEGTTTVGAWGSGAGALRRFRDMGRTAIGAAACYRRR
jgi:hypothetical protein